MAVEMILCRGRCVEAGLTGVEVGSVGYDDLPIRARLAQGCLFHQRYDPCIAEELSCPAVSLWLVSRAGFCAGEENIGRAGWTRRRNFSFTEFSGRMWAHTTALTLPNPAILQGNVTTGERIGYWSKLADLGFIYAKLALGVVNTASLSGRTAGHLFLEQASDEGLSIGGNQLAQISRPFMQEDFDARAALGNDGQILKIWASVLSCRCHRFCWRVLTLPRRRCHDDRANSWGEQGF